MCMQAPQPLDEYNIQLLDNVMPASWIEPQTSGRWGPSPVHLHVLCNTFCFLEQWDTDKMVQMGYASPVSPSTLLQLSNGFS